MYLCMCVRIGGVITGREFRWEEGLERKCEREKEWRKGFKVFGFWRVVAVYLEKGKFSWENIIVILFMRCCRDFHCTLEKNLN